MKLLFKYTKIISSGLLGLLILLNTSLAQADEEQAKTEPGTIVDIDGDVIDIDDGMIAQTFPLHGAAQLQSQFRYIDGKLKTIYFLNTGEPLVLDVLSQDNVIGKGDELSIKVPNVNKIVLHIKPYIPESTDRLQDYDFSKTFIFSKQEDGLYEIHSGTQTIFGLDSEAFDDDSEDSAEDES